MPRTTDSPERLYCAIGAVSVSPSDSAVISNAPNIRALFVGTGGNLTVQMLDDSLVVFKNVPSGTLLPISVKLVKSATTAADILALT